MRPLRCPSPSSAASPWQQRSRTHAPGGSRTTSCSPALIVVAGAWGFVATLDNRMMGPLAFDVLVGVVLGGAPAVFIVWLVAPRLIGGGDWKLLAVLGATVGFLAPAAASVIPMAAFGGAIVAAAARHRREIRLGPFLAAGYVVAVVAARRRAGAVRELVRRSHGEPMKTFQEAKGTRLTNPSVAPTVSPRAGRAGATGPPPGSPAAALASKPGLRMRPQRPMRALVGALVVVASVVAALAIYTRIGNRTDVLAVARDVLAGEQIGD